MDLVLGLVFFSNYYNFCIEVGRLDLDELYGHFVCFFICWLMGPFKIMEEICKDYK